MVEKLHDHPVFTSDGLGITGFIRPSTSEIVYKLNEVIDILNKSMEELKNETDD